MHYIDLQKDVLTYAFNTVKNSLNKGYKNKFVTSQNPAKAAELRYRGFLGEIAAALFLGLKVPTDCYGRKGQDNGTDLIHKGQNIDVKTTFSKSDKAPAHYYLPLRTVRKKSTETNFYIFVKLQNIGADVVRAYILGTANFKAVQIGLTGQRIYKGQPLNTGRATFKAFEDCILIENKDITPLPDRPNKPAKAN